MKCSTEARRLTVSMFEVRTLFRTLQTPHVPQPLKPLRGGVSARTVGEQFAL
jgi:hypothetical protein